MNNTWQPILDLIPEIKQTKNFVLEKAHASKSEDAIVFHGIPEAPVVTTFRRLMYDKKLVVNFKWSSWDEGRVDYLPENDRVRFTIHPDARKEVLKRLLELNHKIHEEEVAAGLFDKKPKESKPSKNKKSKTTESNPDGELFGFGGLFDEKNQAD